MNNSNTSFFLTAATVIAGLALSLGSIADFGTGANGNHADQVAHTATAQASTE